MMNGRKNNDEGRVLKGERRLRNEKCGVMNVEQKSMSGKRAAVEGCRPLDLNVRTSGRGKS